MIKGIRELIAKIRVDHFFRQLFIERSRVAENILSSRSGENRSTRKRLTLFLSLSLSLSLSLYARVSLYCLHISWPRGGRARLHQINSNLYSTL